MLHSSIVMAREIRRATLLADFEEAKRVDRMNTPNTSTGLTKATEAQGIAMTTFKVTSLDKWQERVLEAARQCQGMAIRKGPGCVVWNPDQVVARGKTLKYVDGVRVVREWLGPEVGALTIIPRRMYFEGNADVPSSRPEQMLVGDTKPALPSPAKRISACLDWARQFSAHVPGFHADPMAVGRVRMGLHENTRMVFGGGVQGTPGQKASILLTRHGFHSVPENMRIELIDDIADAKAKEYQGLVMDAFRRCKHPLNLSMVSYDEMQKRLAGGNVTVEPMRKGYCALVAVTGKKGNPLSEKATVLIEALQLAGVPFRMFSVDNKALSWSALDQVGSLLMGAGGIPYALTLPWPASAEPPYILGVDLGHPKATRASWVVMSLMDHRGVLIESWRYHQERDETIGPVVLQAGLNWARKTACAHNGGQDTGFLVIRDGRLNKGEAVQTYAKALGPRMTFLELPKYDNPVMFIPGACPKPAPAGTECLVAGSVTPFVVSVAPRLANDLSRTLKIHMAPSWDGLGLGIDKVSEIVTGLAYTPGLGLATHALPGPIYWADGIAAMGETNHQFAGQRIVNYPQTNLGVVQSQRPYQMAAS